MPGDPSLPPATLEALRGGEHVVACTAASAQHPVGTDYCTYLCNQQNQFSAIQTDKLFQNHYLQGSKRQRHSVKTNRTFHYLLTVFKAVIHDFIQGAPVSSLGRFHLKRLLDASFALHADSPCPIRALAGWCPEHCWTHHGHHTHQLA